MSATPLLLGWATCCLLAPGVDAQTHGAGGPSSRRGYPNFVLFLQDDQDEALGGWTPMKQATALVSEKGATASNWFIHTPICCPSRGELLSGRYYHNIRPPALRKVASNCKHVQTDQVNLQSFAAYLNQRANYSNAWFGKHMNEFLPRPPAGFDCPTCAWFSNGGGADKEPGGFLNATFRDFRGGMPVGGTEYHVHPGTYQANTAGEYGGYYTSIIGNKSIQWVREVSNGPNPFFVAVASKGPHVPATPAPWYADAFSGLAAPRTPDYNASKEQLANHHWLIAQQGPITQKEGAEIDELFRNRWRTLLSVDDTIAEMVKTLEELNLISSTYIIITSDHGYNLGQHRLPSCKLNVYTHDIRIPMVIRGPGIKAGAVFDNPGSNVDIAPTLLGLAGIEGHLLSPPMDGRSIAPLLLDPADPSVLSASRAHLLQETARAPWRSHHLIEYYSMGNVVRTGHLVDDPKSNTYRALRWTHGAPMGAGGLLYSEFTAVEDWNFTNYSFVEIFDLEKDPYELDNLAGSVPAETKRQLHNILQSMWDCAGETCERPQGERVVSV